MSKKKVMDDEKVCSICFTKYKGYGNNAIPVNKGRCCDACNYHVVVVARMNALKLSRGDL